MNIDRFEGQWHQVKGQVKEKWGKLSDDDLDVIDGRVEQLAGAIQKAYGIAKDEAEEEARSYLWGLQVYAWTDQLQGKWLQAKGKAKERWGKLTDDDLTRINGRADQLLGAIQQQYGLDEDAAAKDLRAFFHDVKELMA